MNEKQIAFIQKMTSAFDKLLGMEVMDFGEGYCKTKLPIHEKHMNPIGSIHGGCISSLADETGGVAACSHGYQAATMDCSIHYLRPGIGSTCLYGEAQIVKQGKNVSVYNVTIKDQDDNVLAIATYSYMNLHIPFEI